MGERRAGARRAGFRRVGAADDAGGGGIGADMYDPGTWYYWGFRPCASRAPGTADTTPVNANRLVTYPHFFSRSGVITHLAYVWIAVARSVRFHLYAPAANCMYPGERVYQSASLTPGTGFNWTSSIVTPDYRVDVDTDGPLIYGGLQESGGNAEGAFNMDASYRSPLGTLNDPTDPSLHGNIHNKLGYCPANTYADGAPASFPATGTPETTHADIIRSNSGGMAALLFRFDQD